MYGPILPVINILYIDVFHFLVWSFPPEESLKLGPNITRFDFFFFLTPLLKQLVIVFKLDTQVTFHSGPLSPRFGLIRSFSC